MKRDDRSPEHYISSVEGSLREILIQVRDLVFQVAPDAEETIRYGMLGYPGIACLGAQKAYVSLYLAPAALARYQAKHPSANCGKSCLRFRNPDDIDEPAVLELLRDAQTAERSSDDNF